MLAAKCGSDEQEDRAHPSRDHVNALLLFSTPLAKHFSNLGFAPTYVGVRRLRVDDDADNSRKRRLRLASSPPNSNHGVVYKKIDEHGLERRMTTQEKKKLKMELKKQQTEARKATRRTLELAQEETSGDNTSNQSQCSKSAMETETQNVRDGVPPVLLSPCMALEVKRQSTSTSGPSIQFDDQESTEWCASLQICINQAEQLRKQEDLRPLAYQMIPELWQRMRSDTLGDEKDAANVDVETFNKIYLDAPSSCVLSPSIRPRSDPFDSDLNAVYHLLHRYGTLHISCGAKFGCDLLLYDGPRHERHAFAGLRVYSSARVPTAYDMAAYARCLHTAGKLALMATVKRERGQYRVAIVDLVLQKIANTSSSKRPIGRRRDVGKNLNKV